ncbi:MAG: SIMPL domain-containing protein [Chloroflexia bacterium]|nr:SIMPL domain-containing protein [Chloroflexia bacterium]
MKRASVGNIQRFWSTVPRLGVIVAVTALALVTVTGATTAQVATPVPTEPVRTITVNGHGSVNVTPDTASVELGVTETNTSLEAAQDQVSLRLDAILATLREQGVADDDIQTSSYNVQILYEYDNNGNLRGINGYTVSSTLKATVRNLDTLGVLLDSSVGAGANLLYGISFFVDDSTAPASQARGLAVADARTKADELASAAGVSIVGVVSIQETSAPAPPPEIFMERASMDMAAGQAAPSQVPVQAGSTEIAVDVYVVFEISAGGS